MSGNIYNVAIRRIISAGGKETLAEIDSFFMPKYGGITLSKVASKHTMQYDMLLTLHEQEQQQHPSIWQYFTLAH